MSKQILNKHMNTSLREAGGNKKIPVESSMQPAIIQDLMGNTVVVPIWMIVPAGTTLDDLQWINPHDSSTASESIQDRQRVIISARTGEEYTLTRISDQKVACTCMGYAYRKKCKHQSQWDIATIRGENE